MRLFFWTLLILMLAVDCPAEDDAAEMVDFRRDVAPLLEQRCVRCHSSKKAKGELAITTRGEFLRGGESGPVFVSGKPTESALIRVISGPKPDMPAEGPPLTKKQIEILSRWIQAGAPWPDDHTLHERAAATSDWWSLQPIRRPSSPAVKMEGWALNEIDRFILAALEAKQLHPSPEADRRTLVRRLTYDLLGLPPTPAEVQAFVNDAAPAAYERLVDRLLASPRYGEHWARHWLDVVRFTESDGFEDDQQRPQAWPYRDYVIRSFNDDRPYDQFVRQQIAGDVLRPVVADGIAATGMLVAGPWDAVQRVTPSKLGRLQSREEQLEEIVTGAAQTFLGLSVQCARCHDHKFDPIPQVDYYRFKAIFEGVDHGLKPRVHGVRRLLGDEDERVWNENTAPLRQRIAELEKQLAEAEKTFKEAKSDEELSKTAQLQRDSIRAELEGRRKELATRFPVTLAFTGDREAPQATVVFTRGDITQPGPIVPPAGLSAVKHPPSDWGLTQNAPEAERRIQFANWLTHPDHPLPARVIVNRIWQYHFGTGLVETANDFGYNGSPPSHPELLDWLAAELIQSGWSVKTLHRRILTSAAFRQASVPDANDAGMKNRHAQAAAVDSEARLLWRFPPRRLEGEAVRDSLLVLSGTWNDVIGGPSYKPFTVTQLNTYFYHLFDKDEAIYNRRSLYRMQIITGRSPFLDALDCPSPSVTAPKRRVTVTPQHALALMNDSFLVRKAEQTASRIFADGADQKEQVKTAFQWIILRPPADGELADALETAERHGLATVCWALFNSDDFLYLR